MEIKNYDHIIPSEDFDIVYIEKKYHNEEIVKSAVLLFENNEVKIRIKFDLTNNSIINENSFLFIQETNLLFYSGNIEWSAFDLSNKNIIRNEIATQLPYIERRNDVILIFDDLYVECTNLKGVTIDKVPVDPPTESTDYDDRIEFNSSIFGKQILKLKIQP
ncbi:hypothetical protein [Flavobacterium lacisediminis]|uniref:Uncharacterized protein n=1 Tax=Flavobacterium lacisediminis TaxID=2989705 RepID=A0ABT3EK02_9FLAO|nr:hypothetical protein [Flavobacterium lacisediminis]MCW1148454.1 hypothetical protein [Flavobacterium lacisediminis]